MSRTLTTIALLSVFATNLMGQTTEDPIAKMTSDIIARYTGNTSSAGSYSQSYTAVMPRVDAQYDAMATQELPATPLPRLSPWQSPFEFALPWFSPRMPMMNEGLRLDSEPPASRLPLPADAFSAYRGARPLSMSAASANGIHSVDAVVATDKGDERVELKGTRHQLRKQLKAFSPQAQRVMKRSLGL